jgi:hypothetical protein
MGALDVDAEVPVEMLFRNLFKGHEGSSSRVREK